MAVLTDQQATLQQGTFTTLRLGRFQRFRVTITGIAGEFQTIPLRKRVHGFRSGEPFEGTEAAVSFLEAVPFAAVQASAPAGVGSLDVVFEVRTGADA